MIRPVPSGVKISGIGPTLGAVLVAEVGDIGRFASASKLTCWAGLTPKHHESDTHVRRGPITKQGSRPGRRGSREVMTPNTGVVAPAD
jgi:transposase